MSPAGELLVLGFADLASPPAPRAPTLQTLAPTDASCVLVEPGWLDGPGPLERLAGRVDGAGRLVCIGFGAGGYGARAYGKLLGAGAVFVAAPGADHGRAIGPADLEDLGALFADAADPPPVVRIVSADDSRALDLALADRLRASGAPAILDEATLPSLLLPHALAQSGLWAEQIGAWAAGGPVPPDRDLAALWRDRFAHELELDAGGTAFDDEGALHLVGRLVNRSSRIADWTLAGDERFRIGVRLFGPAGEAQTLAEARCGLPAGPLPPGAAHPFQLTLPPSDGATGLLEIALVCDGRGWLPDAGFPRLRLTLHAPHL